MSDAERAREASSASMARATGEFRDRAPVAISVSGQRSRTSKTKRARCRRARRRAAHAVPRCTDDPRTTLGVGRCRVVMGSSSRAEKDAQLRTLRDPRTSVGGPGTVVTSRASTHLTSGVCQLPDVGPDRTNRTSQPSARSPCASQKWRVPPGSDGRLA